MKQVLGVEVQPTVVREPILDVPAIDMTSSVAETPTVSPASTKKPARRARPRGSQAVPVTNTQPRRRRDGSVGRDTFERVEASLKAGTTKAQAFTQIAADTGKTIGTVSANYYRVSRANGAVKPRQRRAKAAPTSSARGRQTPAQTVSDRNGARADNDTREIDQIVGQLLISMQALTKAMKAQDAEARELRRQLDGVHSALR